jgi:hypothetical protein
MVRSKSEPERYGRELFHLVERIRAEAKYFPTSFEALERELRRTGYVNCVTDYECEDGSGEVWGARLKLNIAAPGNYKIAWTVSLKLHDTPIDQLDHHTWLPLPNGDKGPGGWHRHEWVPKNKRADRKVRIEGFDKGLSSLRLFLVKAFKIMRVEVKHHDDGRQPLPLD